MLPFREELRWPADVYLEGSDQHRGWFQSSLLVGLGTRGAPPFGQVVTHGFVVDEDGKKMSKSVGNTILPQDIIKESGAEIIRLWVAMVDFREEVRLGKQILARVVEAYRKLRNTCRYLLANLYDFDPAIDAMPLADMQEVDRYALARYGEVAVAVLDAYRDYDFPTIFQRVNQFVTVDLSAFYADVSKDRLYTFAAGSSERRSAQTAMFVIADGLVRLLAPILAVTADELWRHLPGKREDSVHMAEFPSRESVAALLNDELVGRWERLSAVRDQVNAALEIKRQDKTIGTSPGRASHAARGQVKPLTCCGSTSRICRCSSSCRRWSSRQEPAAPSTSPSRRLMARSADAAGGLCRLSLLSRRQRASAIGASMRAPGPQTRWPADVDMSTQQEPVPPVEVPPAEADEVRNYARPVEVITIASVVGLDQLTKEIVRRTIPLGEHRPVIDGLLDIVHVQNTGAAFGLLNAADFPYKPLVMIGIAAIALVAIAAYATQLGFQERLARFGLSLILGGAFGNLIDRAFAGHVVDFVDIYWGSSHFWAFNVADAAITSGAALVCST